MAKNQDPKHRKVIIGDNFPNANETKHKEKVRKEENANTPEGDKQNSPERLVGRPIVNVKKEE